MMKTMLQLFTLVLMVLAMPAQATDIQTDRVVLGGLDKVSGRVNTFEGAIGETMAFGNLRIVARTCVMHPPEEKPENAAFLEISVIQPKSQPVSIFSGWMFASNPAISAMDDPVYDVWVLRCENSKASKSG
jgi:hypothetical protein